jgi:methionyl-tRNA formyltransferase
MALRIALFGQAAFGRDVLLRLLDAGHEVVGVYAPPDAGRPEPLAEEAAGRGLPLLRPARMRRAGRALPERVAEHAALGADLNVLAFVTIILPPEVVDAPRFGSLCFHPSLLPAYRGGSALAWQILNGETESGVTVFRPDAGVDTGPIVVQKGGVPIAPTDSAGSLYFDKLYPLGVEAVCEAVELVDRGEVVYRPQDESRASFQGLVDDAVARVDWSESAEAVDRRIRACDPQPGAHARLGERVVRLFDGALVRGAPAPEAPPGTAVALRDGAALVAARGGCVRIGRVRLDGGPKQSAAAAGLAVGDRLA